MPQPRALTPPDLVGFRQQQINLLQALLGLGQSQAPPQTTNQLRLGTWLGTGGAQRTKSGSGGMPQGLEAFFGPLSPFSTGGTQPGGAAGPAQRQGTGVSQFLNQPAPEMQALNTAMPQLQGILSGQITPEFDRNIAMANQQGGRFGSANAILRGEAMRHLLNQQNQAAQTLALLSQNAGAAQGRQAQFADLEYQRRLQLLMSLLGTAQGAAFNIPIQQPQSGGGFGGFLGGLLGMGLGGFAGAAGSGLAGKIFGGGK